MKEKKNNIYSYKDWVLAIINLISTTTVVKGEKEREKKFLYVHSTLGLNQGYHYCCKRSGISVIETDENIKRDKVGI